MSVRPTNGNLYAEEEGFTATWRAMPATTGMKSADKITLIAVNAALEAALAAEGLSELVGVEPTPGRAPPVIVTGQATEAETRPHKRAVAPSVTRTLRIYANTKLDALDLCEVCIATLAGPERLDLSADGFKVIDQRLELSQPFDRTTDTGTEYSFVQRYRFNLHPIGEA